MTEELEPVDAFGARAAAWVAANLPPASEATSSPRGRARPDDVELARIARCRDLQRRIYDGGFAGVCVPREYGGLGLTPAHQRALDHAIDGYDYPYDTQVPTFTPCMAIILEFGTEEQKRRFVPPILRGEAFWMQLLSEPSGGSDVAGALTTAVRDGDEWVLNGSKIWTTGAWWADWGLCLARTNWDVPKHRGLTVFMMEIHQPGIEIHRIEMLNGSREFCQEFMTDVRIPDAQRLGEVDQGWTVGTRWMYHEKASSGGSPLITAPAGRPAVALEPGGGAAALLQMVRRQGRDGDSKVREIIGETRALDLVGNALVPHITESIAAGLLNDQAAAITRLWYGVAAVRNASIAFELTAANGVAWADDEEDIGRIGQRFLMRQASCMGGGTTEMARNVISERVLGMPREWSADRDIPFREVPRAAPGR